jgi:hypothetical protein
MKELFKILSTLVDPRWNIVVLAIGHPIIGFTEDF